MIRNPRTQTLGPARLNVPPRRIPVRFSDSGNGVLGPVGFGTVDDIRFNRPKTGTIPFVSRLRVPPAINYGTEGVVVVAAPGNDYTQQLIKQQQISLASTFTDQQFIMSGTILWYLTSTNLTDRLNIRIADINADAMPWGPGNGVEGLSFSRIYVTNPVAVAGATATLVYFSDTPSAPARFF